MSRWVGWQAVAVVLGLASSSFGQMGGMGLEPGAVGGRRVVRNFGIAGAETSNAEETPVRIAATDGKATEGMLRLTSVVVDCSFGVYEIKPDKVREIRFNPSPTPNSPMGMGQGGMQRAGQVVTTTGEVIEGTVLIPGWWRVETALGKLTPSPAAIQAITFTKQAEPPAADGNPPTPAPERNAPPPSPRGRNSPRRRPSGPPLEPAPTPEPTPREEPTPR